MFAFARHALRRRRRCRSRCWGYVIGQHPKLPIIALTNINRCPIALDWDRAVGLALPSLTPFSGRPQLIASRSYQVRSIPIELGDVVFGVPSLVQVCIQFLNGWPIVDWSSVRHKNCVLRREIGERLRIVVVVHVVVYLARICPTFPHPSLTRVFFYFHCLLPCVSLSF